MNRYALKLEYDGSRYVGYQIQPNGNTIQAELEKALKKIAKLSDIDRIDTVASGRTDSGVHARGQVVHLDYPTTISPQGLLRALDSTLPTDIRVVAVAQVEAEFHARYQAESKWYRFLVDTRMYPDPFKRLYTLHHPYRFNLEHMQMALKSIVGEHDFTSFCSTKTDKEDKVRVIYKASVTYDENDHLLIFDFHGNGFLYNMIRILVGTLLQIGNGLKPVNELERLLQVKDRNQAGPTAPGTGLYLMEVYYSNDPFKAEKQFKIE